MVVSDWFSSEEYGALAQLRLEGGGGRIVLELLAEGFPRFFP